MIHSSLVYLATGVFHPVNEAVEVSLFRATMGHVTLSGKMMYLTFPVSAPTQGPHAAVPDTCIQRLPVLISQTLCRP